MDEIIKDCNIKFSVFEGNEYASMPSMDRIGDKYLQSLGYLIDEKFQGSGADLIYKKVR